VNDLIISREAAAQRGRRLEYFTIVWNSLEGLTGVGAGTIRRKHLLQEQDRIIGSFPEVDTVFGAVGRSDSATDNAPLDLYDTTVMLKPREQWPAGMTYEKLAQQMDAKLQFPGLSNTWTMPVENRLDMALTGIKTPVGMKIQGPSLDGIQQLGTQLQQILSGIPQVRSIFAERRPRTPSSHLQRHRCP
jgi:copper/silver efflux system protein